MLKTNKEMVEEFPFLNPKDDKEYDYSYTILDLIPEGWKKAFGYELCKELKDMLEALGKVDEYIVIDAKEKYGELVWIGNIETEEIYDLLNKYARRSKRTCAICGEPAVGLTTEWIYPFCKACADKNDLALDYF